MRKPPPIAIDAREQARFSAGDRHAILLRQSTDSIAKCDGCDEVVALLSEEGAWLKQRPFEYDHGHARALGGRTHRENGRALCIRCHADKTKNDMEMIAKADAQGGRTGQWARRMARKAKGLLGPLQSRGFSR